jgi:hypothetical protein
MSVTCTHYWVSNSKPEGIVAAEQTTVADMPLVLNIQNPNMPEYCLPGNIKRTIAICKAAASQDDVTCTIRGRGIFVGVETMRPFSKEMDLEEVVILPADEVDIYVESERLYSRIDSIMVDTGNVDVEVILGPQGMTDYFICDNSKAAFSVSYSFNFVDLDNNIVAYQSVEKLESPTTQGNFKDNIDGKVFGVEKETFDNDEIFAGQGCVFEPVSVVWITLTSKADRALQNNTEGKITFVQQGVR